MKYVHLLFPALLGANVQAQFTHDLQVKDDAFDPAILTIAAGDQVHIFRDNSAINPHTFTQVARSTWDVNGTTPLPGGHDLRPGTGDDITIIPTDTIWYVCTHHAGVGMKGVIIVTGANGMEQAQAQQRYHLAPNPARSGVALLTADPAPVRVRLCDGAGRTVHTTTLHGTGRIDVSAMADGLYIVEVRDMREALLSRRHLVVAR
ncbi:MAG: T9SS type A sorting domain-containing protein [Flavobacteriales bacterium]|nr:T9SS type A sorting domain-containing protein [Flavobacteriales bacterium]